MAASTADFYRTHRDGARRSAETIVPVGVELVQPLRAGGAAFPAVAQPGFWWLDHCREFRDHLRARFPCVLANDLVVVFDLRDNEHRS
jgi:hypothetical protein